jgi:Ulp1 family protease
VKAIYMDCILIFQEVSSIYTASDDLPAYITVGISAISILHDTYVSMEVIDYAAALLQRQFTLTFGMRPPSTLQYYFTNGLPIPSDIRIPQNCIAVQIHYLDSHYLVSQQKGNAITIYDSLYNSNRLNQILTQLRAIYSVFHVPNKSSPVQYICPQSQGFSTDCGPFAVANAFYLLSGVNLENEKL